MTRRIAALLYLLCLATTPAPAADGADAPKRVKHQVTGLFSKERERALRLAFQQVPGVTLVDVDFDNAEVTLEYVQAKVFGNVPPDQVVQQLDNRLRDASTHTFGVKPLRTIPREKLKHVVIPVAGLDCEACCLGAYDAIYRLEGVEQATASFRDGRVTAWIDPEKTERSKLEAVLKQREVKLVSP